MKQTFKTTLIQAEGKNATGINVPADIVTALNSGKRPRVKVQIGDYTYQSTIAAYGDVFMLPVSAEHREAAGLQAGDDIEVVLELDTEPRTVEVPDDLETALIENNLEDIFDGLAYSKRKEFVRQVVSAKQEATRQRRLEKIIATLSDS